MSLRIALVTTFYPPHNFGGDGIYVQRLARALSELGCDVSVIYDQDAFNALATPDRRNPDSVAQPSGVKIHALSHKAGLLSVLATQQLGHPVFNAKALDKLFEAGQFDIIHYHNISLVGGPGLLRHGSAPIKLYTAHEHWLVCPTHILWKNNSKLCESRSCISCQLVYKKPPQLWRYTNLLQRSLDEVDAFIALSHSSAQNHEKFGFKKKMRVMPSFLPNAPAPDLANWTMPEKPYVLFAGRLELIKGLQDVVEIFDDSFPVELKIAGSGDFEPQLRRLAADSSKVTFLGRVEPENLIRYYQNALALIAPSKCYEVFPLVALEAFQQAVPLIARNIDSYPEIVTQSKAGLLFEDKTDLKAKILKLSSDPALRKELSQNAYQAFQTYWSEAASLSEYFSLIECLAEEKGHKTLTAKARSLRDALLPFKSFSASSPAEHL